MSPNRWGRRGRAAPALRPSSRILFSSAAVLAELLAGSGSFHGIPARFSKPDCIRTPSRAMPRRPRPSGSSATCRFSRAIDDRDESHHAFRPTVSDLPPEGANRRRRGSFPSASTKGTVISYRAAGLPHPSHQRRTRRNSLVADYELEHSVPILSAAASTTARPPVIQPFRSTY